MLNTWPRLQSRNDAPTGPCFTAHPAAAWAREPVASPFRLSRISELTAATRAAWRRTWLDVLIVGLPPGSTRMGPWGPALLWLDAAAAPLLRGPGCRHGR